MSQVYGKGPFSGITEDSPVVMTDSGTVRGFIRNRNACFYSIPYGNPCEGEGRFRAPVYVDSWTGVKDCTGFIASAMQRRTPKSRKDPWIIRKTLGEVDKFLSGSIAFDRSQVPVSENCLYLNVVTPGLNNKKRPVIVYIHGGGYNSLDGCLVAEQCYRLCDEEDVVVVSVDHRLGVFGYLY